MKAVMTSTRLLLAFSAALALAAPITVPAQDPPAEDKELTREERLRQHEKRVKEIIEQRRKEQLERNKQADAKEGDKPAPAPEAPPQEDVLPRLGRVILTSSFQLPEDGSRASDIVVQAGDRFVSDIVLQNEGGTSFDRVEVALKYDKRFMKPLKIFDEELRPYLIEQPEFDIVDRDSILVYKARLDRPRVVRAMPILRIIWEAQKPIEHTGLNFVFASGDTDRAPHTAVYQGDVNILGDLYDPIDGVLGSSLLILSAQDESSAQRPRVLQGKKDELREIYLGAVGAKATAGIALEGPSDPIAAGEEFVVDVILNNPQGAIIDSVQFMIKFDPEVLQVVDRDLGNWMRRGINVHDGPFRLDYPFDYHKRNEVDNVRGYIHYGMGLGDALALPTGTFAQVHFRALKPADLTEVTLIASRQGAVELTALKTFGYNILTADPALTQPVYAATILPEGEGKQVALTAEESAEEQAMPPGPLFLPGILPTVESVAPQLSHR